MKPPSDPELITRLLARAQAAAQNAYAPYSHFHVGAALATEDGEIFVGVNVENASYGLTICAERVALATAVATGARSFRAIALFSPDAQHPLYPCGACLQVLAEFADDLAIASAGADHQPIHTTLRELLPVAFSREPKSNS